MKPLLILLAFCCVHYTQAQTGVDYRYLQSSVKNQKHRGTCTAFAICAALEVQPGLPSDLSEQYLYAKAKFGRLQDKSDMVGEEGEMLAYYIHLLQTEGVISESKMPYDTNAVRYTSDKDMLITFNDVTKGARMYDMLRFYNETYKLQKDQYVMYEDDEATNVETIKAWLDKGVRAIPVAYPVNEVAWSYLDAKQPVINPDSIMYIRHNNQLYTYGAAKQIIPDLVSKIKAGSIDTVPIYKAGLFNGGHAVTIVGYTKDGFIIKNSWGTGWGDKGYALISYDYHRLFCHSAMIINNFQVNHNFTPTANEQYEPKEICLKTYPLLLADNKSKALTFSFFYDGDKPAPQFSKVEIKYYLKNYAGGTRTYLGHHFVLMTDKAYESGYFSFKSFDENVWRKDQSLEVVVNFTLKNTGKIITNTYPLLEWKNKMVKPGLMAALLLN